MPTAVTSKAFKRAAKREKPKYWIENIPNH